MRKRQKEGRAAGIFEEPAPAEGTPEGEPENSEAPPEEQAPPSDNT
ncbi:MAG: hypothetical protein ACRDH8_14180 [Actinomycetota bacterium]